MIVGGVDWSYDMSGFLGGKGLKDPLGNGIIYANHAYPFKGDTVEKWIAKMEAATKEIPVIVSEFGSDPPGGAGLSGEAWVKKVLAVLEGHKWNWTAWDLHPFAKPALIKDWNYEPTEHFGKWVKQALADQVAASKTIGVLEGAGDVGAVLHPGSASYDASTKTYTLTGSGENMWFDKDAFQFAWRKISGRVSLAADIAFPEKGVEAHRKACLMIRQSLDPDSAYVDVAVHGDGLTSLQYRETKGGRTLEIQLGEKPAGKLCLSSYGNRVVLACLDPVGLARYTGAEVDLAFKDPVYVGIGVCSHNKDVTEKAEFRNLAMALESFGPASVTGDAGMLTQSVLETINIASRDRRIIHADSSKRFEAPNWLEDDTLLFNQEEGSSGYPSPAGRLSPSIRASRSAATTTTGSRRTARRSP